MPKSLEHNVGQPKPTFKIPLAPVFIALLFGLPFADTFYQGSSGELSAQSQEGSPQKISPQPGVECAGKLQPRQRFSLVLGPGERLLSLEVAQGMTVEKGALLARLANDGIYERLAVLEDKRLALLRERDRVQIILIRAENARATIQRIEKKIDEENRILKKVPDYPAEAVLQNLVEAKNKQEEELRIYMKELSLAGKLDPWLAKMENSLEATLSDVRAQIEGLAIRAPFSGRVIFTASEIRGQTPGGRILEIWDDAILQVHAVVFQHQLPLIKTGLSAWIFPHFFENQSFRGSIRSVGAPPISDTVDEFPKFPIIIDMEHHIPDMVAGMGVTVKIFDPESIFPRNK